MAASHDQSGGMPALSAEEAQQRQADDPPALLIDVREVDEYLEVRAPGSVLLPLSQFAVRFTELPQDRPLMMVCHSGARSGRATAFLLQQGYAEVSNVSGGMMAWKRAGLPMRSGPLEPGEGEL